MDEARKEYLQQAANAIIQEDHDLNMRQIYKRMENNGRKLDKDEKEVVKKVVDDVRSAKLKYSKKSPVIQKTTQAFKDLVEQLGLDTDTKNNIVKLTRENADKIELAIKNDDNYFPFARVMFSQYGLKKLKSAKSKALFAVLREIDRDNSTNVWRYKQNRDNFRKVVEYIHDPRNRFWNKLDAGTITLPDDLNNLGEGLKSFSSKVCKYLSEYCFKKDDYYINDSFIRHALPFYLDYYKIKHTISSSGGVDKLSYGDLYKLLDKLNKKREKKHRDGALKKSELDHIIWYCYKSFSF